MGKPREKDVRDDPATFGMMDDAVHSVLDGVQEMFDGLKEEMKSGFSKLDAKADYIHSDLNHKISDLKHDTPTMREFNDLKKRVDFL